MAAPEVGAAVPCSTVESPASGFSVVANSRAGNGLGRFQEALMVVGMLTDFIVITASLLFAYAIYGELGLGKHVRYAPLHLVGVAGGLAVVFVGLLQAKGGYRVWNSLLRVKETEIVLRASGTAFLIALGVSIFANYPVSRWLLVLAFVLVPVSLAVEKQLLHAVAHAWRSRGFGVQKAVIYGAGSTGKRLFSALVRSPKLGLDPVAFVDDDASLEGTTVFASSYTRRRSAPVISGPLTGEKLRSFGAAHVLIGMPSISRERFMTAVNAAAAAGATLSFAPGHFAPSNDWVGYQEIDGLMLASFCTHERSQPYEFFKRAFDAGTSAALLVVLAPLFLLISAMIRLTSPGPVLFVHERVGEDGRLFRMYKFRTMHIGTRTYDFSPRSADDCRITRVGRALRRSSLDELPQLLNVLKGDMSLVGPRPEMPFIVSTYNELHRGRLTVRPGITGLWQLSADRAYLIHENVEYDLYYIRNRNFFMDLAILLHTVIFAARGV